MAAAGEAEEEAGGFRREATAARQACTLAVEPIIEMRSLALCVFS